MKILFYISGHGYGHATRIFEIINALKKDCKSVECYVRAKIPEFILGGPGFERVNIFNIELDAGVVEKDIFSQDVYSTINRLQEFRNIEKELIRNEVDFAKENGIQIIVSDIPPLASEIGSRLGIPIIAVGNFSWDFIYQHYMEEYPEFESVVQESIEYYGKTTLLLRLPFHHEMKSFPTKRDIPIIARKPTRSSGEVKRILGIKEEDQRKVILIFLRNAIISKRAVKNLIENDFIVISTEDFPFEITPQIKLLTGQLKNLHFPDVIAASDLVFSKLGYGIASECISQHKPFIYLPRTNFAEFNLMQNLLIEKEIPSQMMQKHDFLEGDWIAGINIFLSEDHKWRPIQTNGAEVAAEIIQTFLSLRM